mmetsp:Transcript_112173/g.177349  ORF Transcript_112173/g.177349 Transcript_112173/m.177349 type:complete len:333 (-) Transcript_112173:124-1122(-)
MARNIIVSAFALLWKCHLCARVQSLNVAELEQLSSGGDSLRGRVEEPSPGKKNSGGDGCENKVAERAQELLPRIHLYLGTCGMVGKYEDQSSVTITEDGKQALCQPSCKENDVLREEAIDSTELIKECANHAHISMIRVHEEFDKFRKTCRSEESTSVDASEGRVGPQAEVVGTPGSLEYPEETHWKKKLDELGDARPVPGKVRQLTYVREVHGALGEVAKKSCKTIMIAFAKCDYDRDTETKKGKGKVWIAQIDAMLDQINENQKLELLTRLTEISEGAGKLSKKGETSVEEPMEFKDWTKANLDHRDAEDCDKMYTPGMTVKAVEDLFKE